MEFGWSAPFGSFGTTGGGSDSAFIPATDQLVQQLQGGSPEGDETRDQLMGRFQLFQSLDDAQVLTQDQYEFAVGRHIRIEMGLFLTGRNDICKTEGWSADQGGFRFGVVQNGADDVFRINTGAIGGADTILFTGDAPIGQFSNVVIETDDLVTWTLTVDGVSQTVSGTRVAVDRTDEFVFGDFSAQNVLFSTAKLEVDGVGCEYNFMTNERIAFIEDVSGNNRDAIMINYSPDVWRIIYDGPWYNWPQVSNVNCVPLNGVDQFLKGSASFNLNQYSVITVWVKLNAGTAGILYLSEAVSITADAGGNLVYAYNGLTVVVPTAYNIQDGQWHRIDLIGNGSFGTKIFADGYLVGQQLFVWSDSVDTIRVGTNPTEDGEFLNGQVANLFIKTDTQLLHGYPMEEGVHDTCYDVGQGNHLDKYPLTSTYSAITDGIPSWNYYSGCSDQGTYFIPAKATLTTDATGGVISNPAGFVHNGCEINLMWRDTVVFTASNDPGNEVHAQRFAVDGIPALTVWNMKFKCVPDGINNVSICLINPVIFNIDVTPTAVNVRTGGNTYSGGTPIADVVNEVEVEYLNGNLSIILNDAVVYSAGVPPLPTGPPTTIRIGRDNLGGISNGSIFNIVLSNPETNIVYGDWFCRERFGISLNDASPYNNQAFMIINGTGDPWSTSLPVRGPSFWTDVGGTVYEPRSFSDFSNFTNGTFNLWTDWVFGPTGICLLYRTAEYKLNWIPTAEELSELNRSFKFCVPPFLISEGGDNYLDESLTNRYIGEI